MYLLLYDGMIAYCAHKQTLILETIFTIIDLNWWNSNEV